MPRVTHWLTANRIYLNVPKTEIILFRSCKTKITKILNFWIGGQKIKSKTQTKYLGVILDEHLNFKNQIDTKTKTSKTLCTQKDSKIHVLHNI